MGVVVESVVSRGVGGRFGGGGGEGGGRVGGGGGEGGGRVGGRGGGGGVVESVVGGVKSWWSIK